MDTFLVYVQFLDMTRLFSVNRIVVQIIGDVLKNTSRSTITKIHGRIGGRKNPSVEEEGKEITT